jgi:hypothetical protein
MNKVYSRCPYIEKNIGTTWTERKVVDVLSNIRFEFSMCGTFLALTVAGPKCRTHNRRGKWLEAVAFPQTGSIGSHESRPIVA